MRTAAAGISSVDLTRTNGEVVGVRAREGLDPGDAFRQGTEPQRRMT
jgi:hypothetical protein